MPRHFSDQERETIRGQLLRAGLKRFAQAGLRATRIEDICREAGIAKGSFYAFFPHKEALFLAIADQRDAQHKHDILATFRISRGSPTQQAGLLFDLLFAKITGDPLLGVVTSPEEMAALMRKMPPERTAHEERKDAAFLVDIAGEIESTQGSDGLEPAAAHGLMALVIALVLQKAMLSAAAFDAARRMLRQTFVQTLAGDRP